MIRSPALLLVVVPFLLLVVDDARGADDPFAALVRPTEPLTPAEEQALLRPPPGFAVQLFAAEPQINKPINLAFDDRGRMWVSSTVEYPFAAEKSRWVDAAGSRVRNSRDAVKILEDTDGDGRADKVVDFADELNIPIGVLPYGRGCIAWSIPNIWYFEDTDGDDRCDRRTVLFGPLDYSRDVHGNIASLRLGADGWVYATHGFNNQSRFEVRPERLAGRKLGDPGTMIELLSGNTFRFRPDGSAIEVWSRGQVNPFGMCFDRWGQMFTADCHSDPITQILRGACFQSFGRPHDGLGFAPVICPHRHGSTGLCGVEIIEGDRWGAEWNDHILVGNCVTSRINHDVVRYSGATANLEEQPDFLSSGDPWFRPVDMRLGPDGALYVADFYNRIIGHYEVDRNHPGRDRERGRIWRIVRNADGGAKPPIAMSAKEKAAEDWRWTLSAKSEWTNADYDLALRTVGDIGIDARVRRQAAEALAYRPRSGTIAPLWTAMLAVPSEDPALRHTLRIAVRNQLQRDGVLDEWRRLDFAAADAAGEAEMARIFTALDTPEAADLLFERLVERSKLPADPRATIVMLARRLPATEDDRLIELVRRAAPPSAESLPFLQALREGFAARGGSSPKSLTAWAVKLAKQLLAEVASDGSSTSRNRTLQSAAELARGFGLTEFRPQFAEQFKQTDLSDGALSATAEILAGDPQGVPAVVERLKSSPWRSQTKLAEVLAGSKVGAAALVDAAPPRILTVPVVAQKLAAVADAELKSRIAERTKNLPSLQKELEPVLAARRQAYDRLRTSGKLDTEAGKALFTKHCAACHQVAGTGKQVGPQLDGLKARGAERLCEDILDPNRAVDPAFRRQFVTTTDGLVISVLVRRDEGEALVVIDDQGKERTLATRDIENRTETGLSLMPAGYDKLMTDEEFAALLFWLLDR